MMLVTCIDFAMLVLSAFKRVISFHIETSFKHLGSKPIFRELRSKSMTR